MFECARQDIARVRLWCAIINQSFRYSTSKIYLIVHSQHANNLFERRCQSYEWFNFLAEKLREACAEVLARTATFDLLSEHIFFH